MQRKLKVKCLKKRTKFVSFLVCPTVLYAVTECVCGDGQLLGLPFG